MINSKSDINIEYTQRKGEKEKNMRKRRKLLAFLLAGTLAMSSFTVASADEPENETLPVEDGQQEVITDKGGQKVEGFELLTEAQLKELKKEEEKKVTENEQTIETKEADVVEMVEIPDPAFRAVLKEHGIEADENGCVKRADMENLTSLSICDKSGIDITGIGYAVNLKELTLEKCGITSDWVEKYMGEIENTSLNNWSLAGNELTDVSFLEGAFLWELERLDVSDNKITDFTGALNYSNMMCSFSYMGNTPEGMKQIFEKYSYADISMPEGFTRSAGFTYAIILGSSAPFADAASVKFESSDEGIVSVEGQDLTGKKCGEAVITAKYEDVEKTFKVTVTESEMKGPIADEDKISQDQLPEEKGSLSVLNKGQIWNWETEPPKNVSGDKQMKTYVAYWVYRENQAEGLGEDYYALDQNGTLWNIKKHKINDTEFAQIKIADKVRFIVKYVDNPFRRTAVIYITEDNKCYISYVDGENVVTQFVCDNAESADSKGYISKKDGTTVRVELDDNQKVVVKAEKFHIIASVSYVYSEGDNRYEVALDSKGNLWKRLLGSTEWEDKPIDEGVSELSVYGFIKNGTLYDLKEGFPKIADNVRELCSRGYITKDGVYYVNSGLSFVQALKGVKKVVRDYALTEDNVLYVIGEAGLAVPVLYSVVDIFESNMEVNAQREDGSIWDISDSKATEICTLNQITGTALADKGIIISGAEDGVELKVKTEAEMSDKQKAELEDKVKKLHKNVKGVKFYDISLFKDGKELHDLAKAVRVTMPVPEGFGKKLMVYHENQQGKLDDMKATVNSNGTVSFMSSSFSPYMIVDLGESGGASGGSNGDTSKKPSTSNGGDDTGRKAPKTGDTSTIMLYLLLALAALSCTGVVTRRKLNK